VTRRFARQVWGSATDETLRILFKGLARMRVTYEPELELQVPADITAALGQGGAIFVTVHFPLNPLFTRWLYDQGHPPAIIRETPLPSWVWGTTAELEQLRPSTNVMLQIRRKLEEGTPVLLAIDRARAESRPYRVETRFGATEIATSIFTLAQRLEVPVFFFGVRATHGLPVGRAERIEPEPHAFAEAFARYAAEMLR
jgi:lauroyl/myristoyl acyltransferase